VLTTNGNVWLVVESTDQLDQFKFGVISTPLLEYGPQ